MSADDQARDAAARGMAWELAEAHNALAMMRGRAVSMEAEVYRLAAMVRTSDSEAQNEAERMCDRVVALEAENARLQKYIADCTDDATKLLEQVRAAELAVAARDMTNAATIAGLRAECERFGKCLDAEADDAVAVKEIMRASDLREQARATADAATIAGLRAEVARLGPRQRAGQLVANAMHWVDPTFYENARNTMDDPWEHDGRVGAYLEAWRTHLLAAGPMVEVVPCSACGDPADAITKLCPECDIDPNDAGAWMRSKGAKGDE